MTGDTLDALDRHIAVVETRVTALTAALAGLTQARVDTSEGEALLRACRSTLSILRRRRLVILARRSRAPVVR